MAERPVGVTDVASGVGVAQYRTRERTVSAESVVEQYVIPIPERVALAVCLASTFRTTGVAVAGWNVASLFNAAGSGVIVAVRRLSIQVDQFGVTSTVRAVALSTITTAPSTGTLLTATRMDSAQVLNASVQFRGATASDGGAATTLTATAGTRAWNQFNPRLPSGIGQVVMADESLLPADVVGNDPVLLRAGEGLLVSVVDIPSSSSVYLVNVVWDEVTFP